MNAQMKSGLKKKCPQCLEESEDVTYREDYGEVACDICLEFWEEEEAMYEDYARHMEVV